MADAISYLSSSEQIQANYETMLAKYAPVSFPKAMAKTKSLNG